MRSCWETFIDPTIVTLEKLLYQVVPQPLLGIRDAMFIQFIVGTNIIFPISTFQGGHVEEKDFLVKLNVMSGRMVSEFPESDYRPVICNSCIICL